MIPLYLHIWWPVTCLLLGLVTSREAEPDVTNWESAQVRGESECYPTTPYPKRSRDRQWWYVPLRMNLDTTSCRREVGEGGGGCFQGGPLWFQQASVVPAVIPHPHPLCPHCPPPSRSLAWQTGSLPGSASKWQACGGPEGLVRVWPRGSSSLHTPSRGLTLDHDTCRDTQGRGSAGRLGHWGGGCSICSLWKVLAFSH